MDRDRRPLERQDDDDDDDDESVPSAAVCQERIVHFMEVSGQDEAMAQMVLQENGWDLHKAVQTFLGGDTPTQPIADSPPRGVAGAGAAAEAGTGTPSLPPNLSASTRAPETISLLTWNIDGLDDRNLSARTAAVCRVVEAQRVDIVLLQEVVPATLRQLRTTLKEYQCLSAGEGDGRPAGPENYFTVVLLRRYTVYLDSFETTEYDTSVMGRNLMLVDCHIGKARLCIMNTHLESTRDHGQERMKQLRTCFKKVLEQSDGKTVLFGGDLNLRDKELDSLGGVPAGMQDLWTRTGARPECKYTWDQTRNTNLELSGRFKPRCRFDRLYIRDSSPRQAHPRQFGLVGLEKVAGTQSFPSDHWGIHAEFDVNSN